MHNKNILVAGGGIAGLELTIRLAKLGFSPTLCEAQGRLGGLINLAMLPPGKAFMGNMVQSRVQELEKLSVKVLLNTRVTPELVSELHPDLVAVATGSVPFVPPIEGAQGEGVCVGDVLLEQSRIEGERFVVVGGGLVGCEVAQFLADRGKKVLILEMDDGIAKALSGPMREKLLTSLSKYGVDARVGTRLKRIALPNITLCTGGYDHELGGFDRLVLAAGRRPAGRLAEEIAERFPNLPVAKLGDAITSGMIATAVSQAQELAERVARTGQW